MYNTEEPRLHRRNKRSISSNVFSNINKLDGKKLKKIVSTDLGEFSLKNKSQWCVVGSIIVVIFLICNLVHISINDFEYLRRKNSAEISKISQLFDHEKNTFESFHDKTLKELKDEHQGHLNEEYKWIEKELETIHGKHEQALKDHSENLNLKTVMENYLKKHQDKANEMNDINSKISVDKVDDMEKLYDDIKKCEDELRIISGSQDENKETEMETIE